MWKILGIEPTTDIKEVKRAYSKLLKQYHPEDDPEGYQRLREAYDAAIKYIKDGKKKGFDNRKNNAQDSEKGEFDKGFDMDSFEEPEDVLDLKSSDLYRDYYDDSQDIDNDSQQKEKVETCENTTTDSGSQDFNPNERDVDIIMDKIIDIYNDYLKRINLKVWRNLFEHDGLKHDFIILKELSPKILDFLYVNNLLPKEIFVYLSQVFDWESDYVGNTSDDEINKIDYVLQKIKGFNFTDFTIDWNIEGFEYASYIEHRINAYESMVQGNLEEAFGYLNEAYKMYSGDPIVIKMFCEYFKLMNQVNKGLSMANKLIEYDNYSYEALYYRSDFSLKAGDYQSAISDVDTLMSIEKRPEFYYIKASALAGVCDEKEALLLLDEALKDYKGDFQLNILFTTIETKLQKEKGIFFSDIVKERKRNEKKAKAGNTKDGFIKRIGLAVFRSAIILIVACGLIKFISYEEDKQRQSEELVNHEEPVNHEVAEKKEETSVEMVYDKMLGEEVELNRLEIVYLNTIARADINAIMGVDSENENVVKYFIFIKREGGKNYILQFNDEEMDSYQNEDNIITYHKKNILINREEIIESVNQNTSYNLMDEETLMFDNIK